MARAGRAFDLAASALDRLMPMHLVVGPGGGILHAGPTLAKLMPGTAILGMRLDDLVDPVRPLGARGLPRALVTAAAPMKLRLRPVRGTTFKAIAVPLASGGGMVVNLSFGISVADAVRSHALTQADLAPTDLAVEMLYLIEANAAVMDESRSLNRRLQTARVAAEEQAFTDTLTGLKNRRALNHVLSRLLGRGARFGLMHLDLDFFKSVNDSLGHAAGDHVLQEVARILVEETRAVDTVARVGGDEFVLIFDRQVATGALTRIARRIIARLEQPIPFAGQSCRISGSAGIATSLNCTDPTAERLIALADAALYQSKADGRGRVTLAADLSAPRRDTGRRDGATDTSPPDTSPPAWTAQ